jgi:hypothetical protein
LLLGALALDASAGGVRTPSPPQPASLFAWPDPPRAVGDVPARQYQSTVRSAAAVATLPLPLLLVTATHSAPSSIWQLVVALVQNREAGYLSGRCPY